MRLQRSSQEPRQKMSLMLDVYQRKAQRISTSFSSAVCHDWRSESQTIFSAQCGAVPGPMNGVDEAVIGYCYV